MNLISYFFFFSFSLLVYSVSSASDSELKSLLEFRKGIQTDPLFKVKDTWSLDSLTDRNACPQSWTGIYCDENNNVSAIVLDQLGLAGELKFQTLIGLKMLKNLSLSGNDFSGRLVPALGTMTTLQHLDLSGNRFYGPIPDRINDLWGLNYLNFSVNNFTGTFPGGRLNLNQLRKLDFHSNQLSGNIGDVLSQLRNVEYVDLSLNQFYGEISIGLQNVSSLANSVNYLNLSHNLLNGGFFDADSISLFRNLEVLDVSANQITGNLPSFGSLPNLRVLRLGNNQFSGSIPEELFSSSMPLDELDLSGNAFTGAILGINSTTLQVLNLSSNGLSGPLPSILRSCVKLDLSRNIISGDISALQNWESPIEVLDLSSNNLSGNFPEFLLPFDGLETLRLGKNNIVGTFPSDWKNYPRLTAVDLSLNQLSGPIPAKLFASSLINLNLSGNHFTGPIPLQGAGISELLFKPSDLQMEYLDLSDNSFSGGLPSEIGSLMRLKLLNLCGNELSGPLPDQLGKLTSLEYLDLSRNKFTGEIPDNLPSNLTVFNVSDNDLRGPIPRNLRRFPTTSFRPGNNMLILPNNSPSSTSVPGHLPDHGGSHHSSKGNIRVAIIVATVGAAIMIAFVLLAYHRAHLKEFRGRSGLDDQSTDRDVKLGRFTAPSLFKFQTKPQRPPTSSSFSTDHLLTPNSRSLSRQAEFVSEISEVVFPAGGPNPPAAIIPNLLDNYPETSGRDPAPGSPLSSSPQSVEPREQPVKLDVCSPDRLAGELFFLDNSLLFSPEELSRAPAEVLGRSSHGTLYKATLDSGHILTVKWLRVGLVKHKKEFAKEVKRLGSIRHINIVPIRAYYWGPKEQERLLLADYIHGDSLALHLSETTPRRYSLLSFTQRLKAAIEIARCLLYLHDRALPHGNLKLTNILLEGQDYNVRLTDYGLHRLMMPAGISEQILNLGALGYRAPELANAAKPAPSLKADVYAFGVILMELLTRRSAGDIISGQSGAVDLTDWVRLCDQEGRRRDCIDRDITGGGGLEPSEEMDRLLGVALSCILPVNERPNIRQVLDDLCALSSSSA